MFLQTSSQTLLEMTPPHFHLAALQPSTNGLNLWELWSSEETSGREEWQLLWQICETQSLTTKADAKCEHCVVRVFRWIFWVLLTLWLLVSFPFLFPSFSCRGAKKNKQTFSDGSKTSAIYFPHITFHTNNTLFKMFVTDHGFDPTGALLGHWPVTCFHLQ